MRARADRWRGALLLALCFVAGTSWGAGPVALVRAADTDASTPGPALVIAQGLSDETIELTWTAVPAAETYVVYRDDVAIATEPGTLYDDSSLPASTTYTYQVSSIIGGVESDRSTAVTTATQAPQDASPPTQPGSITVSQVKFGSAVLKWKKSTDDVAVLGYRILRGAPGDPLTSLIQVDTLENNIAYTATNLKAGTSYQFAVLALDAGNNTSLARSTTFTTQTTNDSTAPSAPSSSSVSTIPFSSTRIDVVWGASTSTDVVGYRVFRNGTQVAEIPRPLRLTYSDNGLLPGTSYTYKVAAFDSAGNQSPLTTGRIGTTTSAGAVLIKRGPSIQWVTANFARVAWWTNVPAPSTVSYGLGALTDQVTDPVLRTHHVMLIGGLSASTTYTYRAESAGVMSGTSTFITAAGPGSTFSFAAVGDFGGGSPQETAIANLIANGSTQFVQSLGDNVYPDSEDPNFATFYSDFDGRFYKQYRPVINNRAFWAAGGNHEYYGGTAFWQNFWMPNNERWYSFDWGAAHILVLDPEQPFAPGTPQHQFAAADLAANQDKTWRIVVFHRPPYSSSTNNSSCTTCQQYMVPLVEQHDVQVVLSGHSHNYERSYPLVGGVPQETGGVTYFVSGGGGNGVNQFQIAQPSWSAFRAASFEYLQLTVSPSFIEVKAFTDAGILLDSVTIEADEVAPGAITGTVTDAGTGNPLAGASVSYAGGGVTTDQAGLYVLSDVPPGTHNVTAAAAGHVSQTMAVTVSSGQTTQQDFALSLQPHVLVFSDGFESGSLSAWTSSAGLTVQGTIVNSGAFAAEGNTTDGRTYAKKTLPATYSDAYSRIYFSLISASSQVNLLRARTSGDTSIAYLFVNTSGKLGLRNDVGAVTFTSATSVGSGWHSLELHLTISGASSTSEVWLDDVRIDDLSRTTNLGSTGVGRLQIGEVAAGRTYDVVFDDVVFDTQPISP